MRINYAQRFPGVHHCGDKLQSVHNLHWRCGGLQVKLILALTFLFFARLAFASATTVYVSQSGGTFTGGSACNGQTAISLATANSSATWGSGGTQIGPGTTVYLCGALTAAVQTVGLNIQNSGTSGSPIIVLFDTGATLKSPAFAGGNIQVDGCSSSCAGIEILGQSYIIVDGGMYGILSNTENGDPSMMCP